jgi:cobalt/nickel transport system permease protein
MLSEPFAAGQSIIHGLDPRVRLLTAALFTSVVAVCKAFPVLTAGLGVSVALLAAAGLSFKEVARRMLIVNGFILLLWLLLPLTFQGPALYRIGFLNIYRPGVVLSAQITLKANAIVPALIALTATMPFASLGHALNRLRVPDKIVHLLLMSYRYVFVLEQEYHRLLRAAKLRGFRARTNMHTYRTYAYVVGMLFVRSAARADRVHQAMLCRGFKRKFYSLQRFEITGTDRVFFVLLTAATVGLAYWEWSGK